ncbi:uncharacterized protein MONBRDRAFT_33863 [Monosiga brevicollis MX1]|uniref:J domain-containing protein n=1 Tax=Monosiga brevicollis TaxID=81824 RepID=A9V7Z9_MONBE|nr:uncharacterized protein MONBRDRAFT_33863 [Monosiga brevicollis MX1]EDQ86393.1 predicted protein [Monosiga brevicollis MX1]|eukprot:XP_001748783.1 hypothetical protein [Monosiga brevicollis MX1]
MKFLVVAALLLQLIVLVAAGRDFYKILGVARTATKKEIKKAYRKLAMEHHPDKNQGNDEAAKIFQDIGAAYEVLSDDDKRKIYDRHGEEGLKDGGQGHDASDIFSSMFGGSFFNMHFGGNGRGEKQVPRGSDVHIDLDVTLSDLYKGAFIEVLHTKGVFREAPGTRKCNCRTEMRTQQVGPGQFSMANVKVCDDCPNVKLTHEHVELDLEIEPGMVQGQELKFHAEGEPHADGEPGDLIFHINTLKHSRFQRAGNDLLTNITITLEDALTGFEMEVKHLDGHKVQVKREGITAPNSIVKVAGEGMKSFDNNLERGDLYITFDVEFPTLNFPSEAVESLKELLGQGSKQRVYNGLESRFVKGA